MTNATPAQALVTLAILGNCPAHQGVQPWSAIGAARDAVWLMCDRAKSRGFTRSRKFQANCRRGVVTPGILAVATRNHQAQA